MAAGCSSDGDSESASDTTAASSEDTAATTDTTEAGEPGAAPCDGDVSIGFSQPLANPAVELLSDVVQERAEDAGYSYETTIANLDPSKQISDIQTMIQGGVNVLIVSAVDTNAIQPVLEEARADDIPIVVLDTFAGGPYDGSVVTGNFEAAQLAGEVLSEIVGDGEVTAISGPDFAETLVARNEGFDAAVDETGLNVVDTQVGNPQAPDTAQQLTEAWRLEYPDLAGLYTFSDVNAIGAMAAVQGDFAPAIVSVNGEPDAVAAVEAGRLAATVDIQPIAVGSALYFAATEAFCGNELPEEIHIDPVVIDESNAADWIQWDDQRASGFEVTIEEVDGRSVVDTAGLSLPAD